MSLARTLWTWAFITKTRTVFISTNSSLLIDRLLLHFRQLLFLEYLLYLIWVNLNLLLDLNTWLHDDLYHMMNISTLLYNSLTNDLCWIRRLAYHQVSSYPTLIVCLIVHPVSRIFQWGLSFSCCLLLAVNSCSASFTVLVVLAGSGLRSFLSFSMLSLETNRTLKNWKID